APGLLPGSVLVMLSNALSLPEVTIEAMWQVFSPALWQPGHLGHEQTPQLFFPPVRSCTQDSCPNKPSLGDARRHPASLFTLDRGIVPVYISSLRCPVCHSTYHLNYCRQKASDGTHIRAYYPGRPQVLQVETHVLVHKAVAKLFRAQALHSHASALSIARIYITALSYTEEQPGTAWQPTTLRGAYVWDTFYLDALLHHHDEQGTTLELLEHLENKLPGSFTQTDRLTLALQQRNEFMAGPGQEYYAHACEGCLRVTEQNGTSTYIHAAITDGVSVGRPCCGQHNCHEPLPTTQARFCKTHHNLTEVCAIRDCQHPVESGTLTCNHPDHVLAEESYRESGKSMPKLAPLSNDLESLAQLSLGTLQTCDGKTDQGNRKLKGRFGRSYTHNEQLIVRPCGVIVARATFYGAESISSVADMLRAVFPTPQSVPGILFYDNNCHLRRHLQAAPSNHFKAMGQPVDVFHFKSKHSENDEYCGQHCNPLLFPEIYDAKTKTWFFNSSAAEQTNAWFNGYHSIVHDMVGPRYDFFLDEMIKERNRFTVANLEKEGKHPYLVPRDWLLS
ncbi:hypothetical protein CALVIDRAFT_471553, partial [Calocera viscosa TUFC12733]